MEEQKQKPEELLAVSNWKRELDNIIYLILLILMVGTVGAAYQEDPTVKAFVLESAKALFVAVLVKVRSS